MGYRIENLEDCPDQVDEAAEFLARFVEDGEASGFPGDTEPANWRKRMDWWWNSNPYCRSDSPRGLTLRDDSGALVGFYGYIPHDYVFEGQTVPSLILTTSYVRKANRDAALGLFMRANRQKNAWQFVDGSPNEEVRALLSRIGYQQFDRTTLLVYPVRRSSWNPKSWVLQTARAAVPRPNGRLSSGHLVTDSESIADVPQFQDSRLRKHIDRATLEWYLHAGSEPKAFAGWCDDNGTLQAYVLGIPWRKHGQNAVVLIDYGAFGPDGERMLDELVALFAGHPAETGVPSETDLVIWPVSGEGRRRGSPFRLNYESSLFYHLPDEWNGVERVCLPFEGDKGLV